MLFEQRGEVALVAETGTLADLAYGVFAGKQYFCCTVKTVDAQKVMCR